VKLCEYVEFEEIVDFFSICNSKEQGTAAVAEPMHCKKTHRHIPTSEPDDAGPNGQADGKCVQQTCRTFPLCYVIHVGKILPCTISR
jgi:hypothetical protein